jgi:hypothetical protein
LAQGSIPNPKIVRFKGLGPGFWPVTAVLALLSIVSAVYFLFGSLDWMMPGSSQPGRRSGLRHRRTLQVHGGLRKRDHDLRRRLRDLFRDRRSARAASDPPDTIGVQVHDAPKLEFWWTSLPTLAADRAHRDQHRRLVQDSISAPRPALTTEVIGHQFYFEYRYPG